MQVSKDFLIPNLNTSITGICAIVLLMIISYFILHRGFAKGKVAPEAKGAWPIVGHLPLLRGASMPPHITLGDMADKYGPLFTIRLGMHRALVVSNSEMAKECFTINDLQVSGRPKLIASKHFGYNHAMFAFAPYGTYWRDIRKLSTLQLLSNRRLELLKHIRISEVANFLKQLYGYWNDQEKNISGQALVEMKQWFGDLTLNVVLRMVAGKRYSSSIGIAADERESQRVLQNALREFFHLLGMFVPRDLIPFLGFLDLGGYEKAMKKTARVLDDALNKWLQEHKRKREGGTQLVNEEQDFMDVMLSMLRESDHASFDTDTINKSTALVHAPVDMTQSFGLTNLKETPLEILIKPSLPAKLYV
ncbi:hypothetical protein FEM48_Zijuj06G0073900 [Ziziphus jujuba var. spinosa]|uniref:Cytochrome P450 CYP82D47-like n=1 Tax=Ziziphus jujuba var. spinosa TaxID=714518 RepID=A0A978V7Y3_ZIZJJ|nr:hypothetical protein FEM48_Zijuj06G0073900 [Ziziphus jujuba var. spinosa]